MKKKIIHPKKNTIIIHKKIHSLYQDCGYKDLARFSCNICDYEIQIFKTEEERYDCIKPQIKEHILLNHPEYCYGCNCGLKFSSTDDFKNHTH